MLEGLWYGMSSTLTEARMSLDDVIFETRTDSATSKMDRAIRALEVKKEKRAEEERKATETKEVTALRKAAEEAELEARKAAEARREAAKEAEARRVLEKAEARREAKELEARREAAKEETEVVVSKENEERIASFMNAFSSLADTFKDFDMDIINDTNSNNWIISMIKPVLDTILGVEGIEVDEKLLNTIVPVIKVVLDSDLGKVLKSFINDIVVEGKKFAHLKDYNEDTAVDIISLINKSFTELCRGILTMDTDNLKSSLVSVIKSLGVVDDVEDCIDMMISSLNENITIASEMINGLVEEAMETAEPHHLIHDDEVVSEEVQSSKEEPEVVVETVKEKVTKETNPAKESNSKSSKSEQPILTNSNKTDVNFTITDAENINVAKTAEKEIPKTKEEITHTPQDVDKCKEELYSYIKSQMVDYSYYVNKREDLKNIGMEWDIDSVIRFIVNDLLVIDNVFLTRDFIISEKYKFSNKEMNVLVAEVAGYDMVPDESVLSIEDIYLSLTSGTNVIDPQTTLYLLNQTVTNSVLLSEMRLSAVMKRYIKSFNHYLKTNGIKQYRRYESIQIIEIIAKDYDISKYDAKVLYNISGLIESLRADREREDIMEFEVTDEEKEFISNTFKSLESKVEAFVKEYPDVAKYSTEREASIELAFCIDMNMDIDFGNEENEKNDFSMKSSIAKKFINDMASEFACIPKGIVYGFFASPDYSSKLTKWELDVIINYVLNLGHMEVPEKDTFIDDAMVLWAATKDEATVLYNVMMSSTQDTKEMMFISLVHSRIIYGLKHYYPLLTTMKSDVGYKLRDLLASYLGAESTSRLVNSAYHICNIQGSKYLLDMNDVDVAYNSFINNTNSGKNPFDCLILNDSFISNDVIELLRKELNEVELAEKEHPEEDVPEADSVVETKEPTPKKATTSRATKSTTSTRKTKESRATRKAANASKATTANKTTTTSKATAAKKNVASKTQVQKDIASIKSPNDLEPNIYEQAEKAKKDPGNLEFNLNLSIEPEGE